MPVISPNLYYPPASLTISQNAVAMKKKKNADLKVRKKMMVVSSQPIDWEWELDASNERTSKSPIPLFF